MHPKFAEWYRPLLIQADEKFLKSRWELVESTASSLTVPLALDFVRLSFGLPVQDDTAIAALKRQLKSEGLSYVRSTANLELALISDCALLNALNSTSQQVALPVRILASGLICQQLVRNTISREVQAEMFAAARFVIDQLSVDQRRPKLNLKMSRTMNEIPSYREPPLATMETKSIHIGDRNGYINQNVNIQIPDLESINKGIQHVHLVQNAATAEINKNRKLLSDILNDLTSDINSILSSPQEEMAIHWYLLGEMSRDLHRLVSSFQLAELIPIAAKELADLTVTIPGPYAGLAYLDRILAQGRSRDEAEQKFSIRTIVEAIRPLWQSASTAISGFDGVQDLTPLLCALSYATAGSDSWLTMVPRLCHVPIETALPAREMAYQLYQEILFSRLAKQQLSAKGGK